MALRPALAVVVFVKMTLVVAALAFANGPPVESGRAGAGVDAAGACVMGSSTLARRTNCGL